MGVSEKSAILAVALTLAPVAFAAWAKKSRALFVFGAIGAVIGLLFVPYTMWEWEPSATERD